MKKTIAMILCVVMIAGLSVPAMAANEDRIGPAIAYERIDENTVESRKTAILVAREAIIYSESWVADGVYGEILDQNGKVKEVLPQFSDIFPEDWDIPVERNSHSVLISSDQEVYYNPYFNNSVWLSKPPSQGITPPFCSFVTTGFAGTPSEYVVETVYTYGIYGNLSKTAFYNLGYTNVTTGASLAYAVDLENGDTFKINPPKNITIGVRASSNYIGDWWMRVDGKTVFTGR